MGAYRIGEVGHTRTDYNEAVLCPRCYVRTLPLGYPGATSRFDSKTEICSECGSDEHWNGVIPPTDWPVGAPRLDGERTRRSVGGV